MKTLKILKTEYLTHDVKRFVLEKPEGFSFTPGQAAELSIKNPSWKEELRPFTFTSLPSWTVIEFIIKIYSDHKGVTYQLAKLKPGDELLLHEVFNTFVYKGPGIFLAGGNGVTPFIALLRSLYEGKKLQDVALLYSNKTPKDVVIGEELYKMLGPGFKNIFTRESLIGFSTERIDQELLSHHIDKFDINFYICGPEEFTKDLSKALKELGANTETISV